MKEFWVDGATDNPDKEFSEEFDDENAAIRYAKDITAKGGYAAVYRTEGENIAEGGAIWHSPEPHYTDHATQTGMYDRE